MKQFIFFELLCPFDKLSLNFIPRYRLLEKNVVMETLFPSWSLKCIYMYIKIFTGPDRVCMLVWAGGGQAMKAVGIWVS